MGNGMFFALPVTENFPISTSRVMYAHPPYKYGTTNARQPQWLAIGEDTLVGAVDSCFVVVCLTLAIRNRINNIAKVKQDD